MSSPTDSVTGLPVLIIPSIVLAPEALKSSVDHSPELQLSYWYSDPTLNT